MNKETTTHEAARTLATIVRDEGLAEDAGAVELAQALDAVSAILDRGAATDVHLGMIHGCSIVGAFSLPPSVGHRPSRVIMVDKGAEVSFERWVVSLHCEQDENWCQGYYFDTFDEALVQFVMMVRRECR